MPEALTFSPGDEAARASQIRQQVWESFDPKFRVPHQVLGRRASIGCVALEITQRCNLDCTLCYLSENSEKVKKDISLEEVFQRIDRIYQDFGASTNVQITGGDPTLRKRDELIEIVRYVRQKGMRAGMNTNGILATREMLQQLSAAGLQDISLHVDITQKRKGYKSEMELNAIRRDYIERARGLGLNVTFSTTVCDENISEIPELTAFFLENIDVITYATFQMQADTGRGAKKKRVDELINFPNITSKIERGLGGKLSWENVLIGHPECHRIGYAFVAGKEIIDMFDDRELIKKMLAKDVGTLRVLDGGSFQDLIRRVGEIVAATPSLSWTLFKFLGRKWLRHWRAILKARFRLRKLTIFCQNFMDADNLNMERIHHCSFKVATADGAISMCLHNAIRDEFILPETRNLSRDQVLERLKAREQAALAKALEVRASSSF